MNLTLASIILILATNVAYVNSFILNCTSDTPHVDTPLGGIRGYYNVSYHGRRYAAFEGIPYALPPTGELRFQPPQRTSPWPKCINATAPPDACLHYNAVFDKVAGNEDCLYLSIYVPRVEAEKNVSLPVLFWIHGGGFQRGMSSNYRARYLMDRDVILVTINYRLNVFGFLSTGDDVVPGNMGLKDQNLALRWVNENIEYFGGDPKKITIAGVSAGGASVHYHYLSPMSRGLFRNGISFSGSALGSWAHRRNSTESTKTIARAVNCTTTPRLLGSAETIDCLRKVSAGDVIRAMEKILKPLPTSYMMFPPVVENTLLENYFVNKSPEEIVRNREAYDAPWIAGVVQDDGLFVTGTYILNDSAVAEIDDNWETHAPYALNYKHLVGSKSEQAKLAEKIKRHYFGDKSFVDDRKNLTTLIGDYMIAAPVVKAAQLQAKFSSSPVWFYHYTYRAAQSYADALTHDPTVNLGVSHDDDIYLVLENRYIDPTTTASDRAMLEEMLDFWYSLVSDRTPKLSNDEWKSLNYSDDVENFRYTRIAGPRSYAMEVNDDFGGVEFWQSIGLL